MRSDRGNHAGSWGARAAAVAVLLAAATAPGQTGPGAAAGGESESRPPSLSERQRVVRDRVQRLESRMLKLAQVLAESEPAKAERLRDALEFAGGHRIKARVERLAALLESEQFSEADQQQEQLLGDLDALLKLLTSSLNEVERRRAERQRLEELKRAIRTLMDEQLQIIQRTQHVEQRTPSPDSPRPDDVTEMLRQLERLQRETQRGAEDLQREMRESDEQDRPTPGEPQMGRAAEQMQRAANSLGDQEPAAAKQSEEQALQQLQQALDELDDALRQVRREESEETLAALEVRFRSMLTREQQVLAAIAALDAKGAAGWTRVDELQLAEATETQRGVHGDCQSTMRILLDEGTTVIVPELLRQMATDMAEVAERLERSDTSPAAQATLADIIALLEEVLDAIEQKRADDARAAEEGQSGDGPRPLLPGSAELKLLRGAQLRLNERTRELGESGVEPGAERAGTMQPLAERQRRLADLARRMHERK